MDIVGRVRGLIFTPREAWQAIAAEPVTDAWQPLKSYAAIVSALPVLAGLLGGLVFGGPGVGGPGFAGLVLVAIATYALGLLGVVISAKLIEVLAPRFGGTADPVSAMKLAAHAPTASWLAGVSALVPALGFLSILGLYSLYIFWVGVPLLVHVAEERRLLFTLALIGCILLVNIVLALLVILIL